MLSIKYTKYTVPQFPPFTARYTKVPSMASLLKVADFVMFTHSWYKMYVDMYMKISINTVNEILRVNEW
jgi:hypothetical protein